MKDAVAGGTCAECGFMNATSDRVNTMRCGGCGKRVRLEYVKASFNGEMPCDSRCQYAVGPVCSCSCAGDNHKRGYIHVEMVPVWVRDRDRARHEGRKTRAEERERRVRKSAEERRVALLEGHPALAVFKTNRYDDFVDNAFMYSMQMAFRHGDMTDRQAAAAVKWIDRDQMRAQERAERERVDEEHRAAGVTVPKGRVTFSGRIVSIRVEANQHAYHARDVLRGLIVSDDGWKVWGTLPSGLDPRSHHDAEDDSERDVLYEQYKGWVDRLPGRVVTVTATVEPSGKKDPLFGFMKRAKLVSAEPLRPAKGTRVVYGPDGSYTYEFVPEPEPEPERVPVRLSPWEQLLQSI